MRTQLRIAISNTRLGSATALVVVLASVGAVAGCRSRDDLQVHGQNALAVPLAAQEGDSTLTFLDGGYELPALPDTISILLFGTDTAPGHLCGGGREAEWTTVTRAGIDVKNGHWESSREIGHWCRQEPDGRRPDAMSVVLDSGIIRRGTGDTVEFLSSDDQRRRGARLGWGLWRGDTLRIMPVGAAHHAEVYWKFNPRTGDLIRPKR